MKTTSKKMKDFDTVETFREIKEKISEEIYGMTSDEIVAYFNRPEQKPKAEQNEENESAK